MKNIIVLLALSVCADFVYAQPYANWINYSFSQRVTDIDIYGDYVWVSTQGGLVKYNKINGEKSFYNRANFNLPDNNLLGVYCAENGDVWVSSKYYGIGKLANTHCVIYNQSNSGLPFDQLNSKVKLDNKGNVWIASFRWMAKYDGNYWESWITGSDVSPFPIISDFEIDDNNIVWICSTDGLGRISNGEYTIIEGIYGSINQGIGIDHNNNIWIAQEGRGLYKYDGISFTNYNPSNSCLPSNYINSISFDKENNMWLASGGLIKFKINECDTFNPPKSSKGLLAIKCDENGIIWCGTFSGQLLKFDGSKFSTIELSNSPLKSNYAAPLLNDSENSTWIGTKENIAQKTSSGFYSVFERSGLAAIQNGIGDTWLGFNEGDTCLLKITQNENTVFDSINSPFNANSNAIAKSFAIDNVGNLWISTRYYGLFKYDGTDFINFTTDNSDIPSNEVTDLAFDKNNDLWGGSAQGLFKFDGTSWAVWNTENSSIPTNLANRLIIDSEDNIWFACMDEDRIVGEEYGGGLTKFDGQTMTSYNMANSALLSNTIFGILDNGDKIWLATYGAGLMSFDKTNNWEVFDVTNSGIANNIVQGLVQDKNGNIWMGHNDAGISVFNPDSSIQTLWELNEKLDSDFNSKLVIYPNPLKNELFIKIDLQNEKIIKADIYDVNGKLMQIIPVDFFKAKSTIYNFQIQPDLPENQILILSLKADSGNVFNGRFIIIK